MFDLDGLFSVLAFWVCFIILIMLVILKLAGLLLVGWWFLGIFAFAALVFLLLAVNGIG